VIASGDDGTVRVWRLADGTPLAHRLDLSEPAWIVALHGGRYGEAEQLYSALLHHDHRRLGPEYRQTLAARRNLARMIGRQGRYPEAEQLCRQVLADQRRLLGDTANFGLRDFWCLSSCPPRRRSGSRRRCRRHAWWRSTRITTRSRPTTIPSPPSARSCARAGSFAEVHQQVAGLLGISTTEK